MIQTEHAPAPSAKLLQGGKKPGEFAPAMQSNSIKRKIVREVKTDAYPDGLSVPGAFRRFFEDLKKPIDERYVQRFAAIPDGGVMIMTCLASLMKLLVDPGVTSFENDTPYKRVKGDINEWEVVIFLKALQRVATIATAYVNGASTDFFECLYDEFEALKQDTTGKPVAFKLLVAGPGGNLLAMNSDMEGPQVLGGARSLFKPNVEEYNKLVNDTPAEEIAPEIIKLCMILGKRAVLDFKPLVCENNYTHLMDFVYIESPEQVGLRAT
ncbi:hypothetical protein B0H10DRAFT_2219808 [Mycena sp. CBHHK59/15]|nr:hypothetical protein B0H10DRAFT_2219808 [Mycena sp. CBHHK59/15]